ncbi:MAG: 2-hydroxyacyl-CoA dehydratase family protein [Planctomycetaceae bacterium]|nr:2-hydroxyacyl-CoA dehydratase family protein [Planctomycetaceae bacterium]
MKMPPEQITLEQWDKRYPLLKAQGLQERFYGGPLGRHAEYGDTRLRSLKLDNSPAALALWNLLLSENERLHRARAEGRKIVGTMKDLGTVPVLADCFKNVTAFYPDGAWWTPCLMEQNEGLFESASQYGFDESFCPVRAMVGAFINGEHFPIPDALICSTGAICDDVSAITQKLVQLGFAMHWWEMPRRRMPDEGEESALLPCGWKAPRVQVEFVQAELAGVKSVLEALTGRQLVTKDLRRGIQRANGFRRILNELRLLVYTADPCPMGSLEMLAAEMLALHYCSDYTEATLVLEALLDEVGERLLAATGVLAADTARVFWVNPPADLRAMNLLEECGGRVCGTEYLFAHTLAEIREDIEPLEALARTALADPMVGSTHERAEYICRQAVRFGAEGVVISRIGGASHCAVEGRVIGQAVRDALEIPVVETEIQTLCDSADSQLRTRLEALVENIKQRRSS